MSSDMGGVDNSLCLEGGARMGGAAKKLHSDAEPLVSIVTVVFNDVANLQRTIDSIASQTYQNIEHIVIDGGSTDGTLDIIRRNSSIDYWVSERDCGIYDAMNKGVRHASGAWINFMNSGDVFFDRVTVKSVFLNLDIQESDLIYGDVEVDYGVFKKINKAGPVSSLKTGMQFSHQSLFARRSILEEQGFDLSYRTAADYNFIFLCWVSGCQFIGIDLVVSSVSSGGISDVQRLKSLEQRAQIVERSVGLSAADRAVFVMERLRIRLTSLLKRLLPPRWIDYVRKKK
ncbi:glycosyltransferase [Pseudomonas proteolytica]|uniref:glycosyltransferase family 2 protein n=1 Tax=Pseudomonas proteolytica TaxID=219574 RepID=UPI001474808A|nr:glycosyltransferase family 2 protein [Pseudomonas proteolytica]NMZ24106.1 glycosyltransferase [Pseudomonas proteolytica]